MKWLLVYNILGIWRELLLLLRLKFEMSWKTLKMRKSEGKKRNVYREVLLIFKGLFNNLVPSWSSNQDHCDFKPIWKQLGAYIINGNKKKKLFPFSDHFCCKIRVEERNRQTHHGVILASAFIPKAWLNKRWTRQLKHHRCSRKISPVKCD